MIDRKRIEGEARNFFEWPSDDKTYVTTASMLIFVNTIAAMVRDEEREMCAQAVEAFKESARGREWVPGSLYDRLRKEAAASIRQRKN